MACIRTRSISRTLEGNSALSRHVFIKLLVLALFDVFITLPMTLIMLTEDLTLVNTLFWPGWKAVHNDFGTIRTTTSEQWRSGGFWPGFNVKLYEWFNPAFALAFFLLFGLTEQKRAWYRSLFWSVMKVIGFEARIDPVVSDVVFGSHHVDIPVLDGEQEAAT